MHLNINMFKIPLNVFQCRCCHRLTDRISLVTVGKLAELSDRHGLLLNVVLREEAWLARHNLLNRSRDHQVIDVVIWASRLPFLWWDNLEGERKKKLFFLLFPAHHSQDAVFHLLKWWWKPNATETDVTQHNCLKVFVLFVSSSSIICGWLWSHKYHNCWELCISTYFGQACSVCSLGLHVCNIAAEVFKFLGGGVKSHDPLGTGALGNPVWCHPKVQWVLPKKIKKASLRDVLLPLSIIFRSPNQALSSSFVSFPKMHV